MDSWDSHRDSGIKPRFVSDLPRIVELREEFLAGARIMGLIGGRKTLAPQQLLLSDMHDAGRKINAVLYPRRSAKSTTLIAKAVGRALAREDYRVGILTMTTGKAGRSRFSKDVVPLFERNFPDKRSSPWMVGKSAGQERVVCRETGGFVAWLSSIEDLRGEAFDWVILDEGGEAEPEKVEDALAAALPTLDTRPDGQVTAAGTAGKYRQGNLLWDFLEMGRNGNAGIAEFSGPESTTAEDIDTWEKTSILVSASHPGVNTLTTLDSIKGNWQAMKPDVFMREYLSIFGIEGSSRGLIKPGVWVALAAKGKLPMPPERFSMALSVHRDQTSASIVAAWRVNGKAHVLVLERERGVVWVVPKALELIRKYRIPLVHDTQGVVNVETEALARKRPKPRLLPQTTKNITTAAALLLKEIETGNLVHYDQPALNDAARDTTKRRILSAWGFGSESLTDDITSLEAAAMALRVYDEDVPRPKLKPNF